MQTGEVKRYFKSRDSLMCNPHSTNYKQCLFTNMLADQQNDGSFKVTGVFKYDLAALSAMKKLYLKYWAASPPSDYSSSYYGSRLPFATEDIALENTPNMGVVPVVNGQYDFVINYPNAYYRDMGTEYVPPSVYLQVTDEYNNTVTPIYRFQVDSPEMFTNQNPGSGRYSPKVSINREPIRSQAEMLKRRGLLN